MTPTPLIVVAFLCLLHCCITTNATEYVVGDDQGWDLYPEVTDWPKGKHFKAGDVLVFNYNNTFYAVEAVDESQYQACNSFGHPKKVYNLGHDRVVLEKGPNYFICGVMDYCGYGMKLAIDAE